MKPEELGERGEVRLAWLSLLLDLEVSEPAVFGLEDVDLMMEENGLLVVVVEEGETETGSWM